MTELTHHTRRMEYGPRPAGWILLAVLLIGCVWISRSIARMSIAGNASTLESMSGMVHFDIYQDSRGNRLISEHDNRSGRESPESVDNQIVGSVAVESSFIATTSEWSFLVLVMTGTGTTHMSESVTCYAQDDAMSAGVKSNDASDPRLEWLKSVKAYTSTPEGEKFLSYLRSPKWSASHSLLTPTVWIASSFQPLFAVGAGFSLWCARARFQREHRFAHTLCPECSYPRESHESCPECGLKFAQEHPTHTVS